MKQIQAKRQDKRRKKWRESVTLAYTFLFLATVILAFWPFWGESRQLIWNADGLSQHYPVLVYTGEYWRNLFHQGMQGNFTIPMINFNAGLGMDVFTTLNYYGLQDPLNLLSVAFPAQAAEYLYTGLILLRLYLSGLSFCYLCRYFRKSRISALTGSIVYVFSGALLCSGLMHPFFLNPAIQFPLLIVGCDQILHKKTSFLFIFTLAYSALCGFYFLYMMSLLTAFYGVLRFFDQVRQDRIKAGVSGILRFAAHYIGGLGLAAPVLLPAILSFLSSYRSGIVSWNTLFYPASQYLRDVMTLSGPLSGQGALGMAAICLFALASLALTKGRRTLKLSFIVLLLLYWLVPAGSMMNGFSYSARRWIFAFALLLAYITADQLPRLIRMSNPTLILCTLIPIGYTCLELLCKTMTGVNLTLTSGMLWATWAILATNFWFRKLTAKAWPRPRFAAQVIFAFAGFNVIVNVVSYYSLNQAVHDYAKVGFATEKVVTGSAESSFVSLTQTSGVRVNGTNLLPNGGMLAGVSTPLFYWSIVEEPVTDFYLQTECPGLYTAFRLISTGPSLFTNTLLSMQYQIEKGRSQPAYSKTDDSQGFIDSNKQRQSLQEPQSDLKKQAALKPQEKSKTQGNSQNQDRLKSQTSPGMQPPFQAQSSQKAETGPKIQNDRNDQSDPSVVFGYVPTVWNENSEYQIYENKYALPLGYTYRQSVSETQTEELNGLEKQVLMLQSVILADSESLGETPINEQLEAIKSMNYEIVSTKGVQWDAGRIEVKKPGGSMTLSFRCPPHDEVYLRIAGLNIDQSGKETLDFTVHSQHGQSPAKCSSPEYTWYLEREDYLFDLGISQGYERQCTITFSQAGVYSLKTIEIYAVSLEGYAAAVEELREEPLTIEAMDNNEITGTLHLSEDKYLCLSVPYSRGWKAKVDGKETEIIKGNYMFMTIPVEAGDHTIVFSYCTPGLKTGALLSGISGISLAAYAVMKKIRSRFPGQISEKSGLSWSLWQKMKQEEKRKWKNY